MKRFHFRLERLLDIRKYREREWELKLAAITGICVHLAGQIEERRRELVFSLENRRQEAKRIDMYLLSYYEMYAERLKSEMKKLKKELVKREEEKKRINQKYLEVSRERKILDKLKEKKALAHYKDQIKEDFKTADNINTDHFKRE